MLLYYITDRQSCPSPLEARVRDAFEAGVDMVQLREKDLEARALCTVATALTAQPRQGKLLINARLDVALASGADGVHLPSSGPAPSRIRSASERSLLVGVSCHAPDEVARAEQEGADFAVFGPVFDTPSKRRYGPPQGLERLAQACRLVRLPVLALGGVSLDNAAGCLERGAAGLAAISLFQRDEPLAPLVAQLRALESPR
ncbi:MAG: thiamine phosphate synthase [Acidobacteria bacterium]|nr:thiamine phosphate synthase [Acidobacteriota bacterium]